jgi:SPP1 gp7 family putative phage head morphogenesis protein
MFCTPDGRVLFVERRRGEVDEAGKWAFPGGSIEPGEGPKRAARREVQEETGFLAKRLGAPIDRRLGFVTYRVWVGQAFEPKLNYEHTGYRWAHPDEAPQPLHPGVRATLDKLAAQDRPRYRNQGVRIMQAGREIMAFDGKAPTLTPIRPAAPGRIKYQRSLDALIEEMAQSLVYWVKAAYRANRPATVELAEDAASSVLQAAFDKLRNRWLRKFDELAPKISEWFVAGSKARVDGTMQADLRKGGFTVKFKMTKAMRDAYNAVIDENVGLIRSIAEQHLTGVQTDLMQSVQNGRDLEYLTKAIEKRTGVTKRRAARIARDQNNKATAVMVRTRALELGVTKARWLHSAGGKVPRPEHVKFSGQTFDLAKGHDFNNGEGIVWPGTAINCRCVSVPIVPGFE